MPYYIGLLYTRNRMPINLHGLHTSVQIYGPDNGPSYCNGMFVVSPYSLLLHDIDYAIASCDYRLSSPICKTLFLFFKSLDRVLLWRKQIMKARVYVSSNSHKPAHESVYVFLLFPNSLS